MAKFWIGLLVGLFAGAAGMWAWKGRGGGGEVAAAEVAADAGPGAGKGKKAGKGKRGAGGARRGGAGGGGGPAAADDPEAWGEGPQEPEIVLSADDLRPVSAGDALKVRDRTLDLGEDSPELHDLTQAEIDGAFAGVSGRVIDCISEARGAAPVTGSVRVGMVVGPDGRVVKSRVEAPSYLMQKGLYACVKRSLAAARFPAPGRDTVVTVPITIE
jgi:hypothetical protein